jgi:hypothetical protein
MFKSSVEHYEYHAKADSDLAAKDKRNKENRRHDGDGGDTVGYVG